MGAEKGGRTGGREKREEGRGKREVPVFAKPHNANHMCKEIGPGKLLLVTHSTNILSLTSPQ